MQDEKGLIKRVQRNDPGAFTEVYERHFDMIYRYVYLRVGNQMEAEDLTQQVFLKAHQSISSYKWRGALFSSWLFRIAHTDGVSYTESDLATIGCEAGIEALMHVRKKFGLG